MNGTQLTEAQQKTWVFIRIKSTNLYIHYTEREQYHLNTGCYNGAVWSHRDAAQKFIDAVENKKQSSQMEIVTIWDAQKGTEKPT